MTEGLLILIYTVGGIVAVVLTAVWILVPFVLMRIEKNTKASADHAARIANATAKTQNHLATISQQLDYLVTAKAEERAR